jgi:hypothetical protein
MVRLVFHFIDASLEFFVICSGKICIARPPLKPPGPRSSQTRRIQCCRPGHRPGGCISTGGSARGCTVERLILTAYLVRYEKLSPRGSWVKTALLSDVVSAELDSDNPFLLEKVEKEKPKPPIESFVMGLVAFFCLTMAITSRSGIGCAIGFGCCCCCLLMAFAWWPRTVTRTESTPDTKTVFVTATVNLSRGKPLRIRKVWSSSQTGDSDLTEIQAVERHWAAFLCRVTAARQASAVAEYSPPPKDLVAPRRRQELIEA